MAHTLQDRYSNLVDAKLRYTLVKKDGVIFNNRYEGNPKAGAVKIPVRDTEVTVSAYDKASGATATSGATSYLTVTINKDYAVNEIVDGYDAAAVPDGIVADRLGQCWVFTCTAGGYRCHHGVGDKRHHLRNDYCAY